MDKQMTLSMIMDDLAFVDTPKKVFLERMDTLIPWKEFTDLIAPYYYDGKRGNKPYELELMIRLYLLQNLYNLSDMGTRNEVIDSRAFSSFCRVSSRNQIPDGDTLGRFRHILEKNHLQEQIFETVLNKLRTEGKILKKGTIVDSTIIDAPSSAKNKEKSRDPEAHSTKKGRKLSVRNQSAYRCGQRKRNCP